MYPEEARNRQEKLKQIVLELSENMLRKSDELLKRYANRLQDIYKDGFKHRYSDFFPIILDVIKIDKYNTEFLINNLEGLDLYLEKLESEGINDYQNMHLHFLKLVDHINLQISQLAHIHIDEVEAQRLREQLATSDEIIKEANKRLEKANKGIKKANQEASKMHAQMATILGIFAAIVIAFSGGLTVLGNSISAIGQAKYPESIVLALIICGIIIFDSLSYLMYMISRIIDRNILIGCRARSCAECNENDSCNWGTRVRKRFPYLFYFNLFAGLGIIVDMVVWFMDIRGFIG